MSAPQFSAVIKKSGINPYVDVPPEVSRAFGGRGYIPVKGTLNGYPLRATLVPLGKGRHRLFINGEMRKGARVGVGDTISIMLETDLEPRELPVPDMLAAAFEKDREAKAIFDSLTPSHRKEYLAYLNSLKQPETLQRNIERMFARLKKRG